MYSVLSEIISSNAILKHEGGKLTFVEPSPTARLRKISFTLTSFNKSHGGLLKNAVVIDSDNNQVEELSRFCFYLDNSCPSINRQCDYIVFHYKDNKLNISLCELKSSDTSADENARIHNQLTFSKIFAEYLLNVAKERAKQKNISLDNLQTNIHKVALIHIPNVVTSTVLGQPQLQQELCVQENNGIKNIFLRTDSAGHASLPWHSFMDAVNNS